MPNRDSTLDNSERSPIGEGNELVGAISDCWVGAADFGDSSSDCDTDALIESGTLAIESPIVSDDFDCACKSFHCCKNLVLRRMDWNPRSPSNSSDGRGIASLAVEDEEIEEKSRSPSIERAMKLDRIC